MNKTETHLTPVRYAVCIVLDYYTKRNRHCKSFVIIITWIQSE